MEIFIKLIRSLEYMPVDLAMHKIFLFVLAKRELHAHM